MINRNKKAKNNETFENRSWVKGNVFNGLAQLSLIEQRRFNMKLFKQFSFIFLATVFLIASAGPAGASEYTVIELFDNDVGLRDNRTSPNPGTPVVWES